MQCKREEAENPHQEASTFNPQLLHEDGDLKVFGNKASDTQPIDIIMSFQEWV